MKIQVETNPYKPLQCLRTSERIKMEFFNNNKKKNVNGIKNVLI